MVVLMQMHIKVCHFFPWSLPLIVNKYMLNKTRVIITVGQIKWSPYEFNTEIMIPNSTSLCTHTCPIIINEIYSKESL